MTTMEMYEAIKDNEKALAYADDLFKNKNYSWKDATVETYMLFADLSRKEAKA